MNVFPIVRQTSLSPLFLLRSILFLPILLLLGACQSEDVTRFESSLAGNDPNGFDQCEFFGRYSDRVCDADCPLPDPDCDSGDIRNIDSEGPTMCVAIRGNGDRIPAHFAGMARIFEEHGLISGVAGGSSAALSLLLIESIQKNSAVRCGDCSAKQKGERAALLMKSLRGYMDKIATSDDFLAAQSYTKLLAAIEEQGIDQALAAGSPTAPAELQTLLNSERFRSLINPEIFQLLRQSPDPAFHSEDIVQSIKAAVAFSAGDPNILVRPGLLNFSGLAEQFGLAADFYIETDFHQFMSSCADQSVGKTWAQIQQISTGTESCGHLFNNPLSQYLQRRTPSSQLDRPVGEFMHTLIPTSVLEGQSVSIWNDAFAAYKQAQPITPEYNFSDIRFGYFGHSDDLQTVLENRNGYTDEKTRRFRAYGNVSWREALKYSPAEPGLSRALALPDGRISAGGWSDLHPVLALKNLGCDKVIYLTRQGNESRFARGVSSLLGLQPADDAALYDLSQPASGFSKSLEEADGVWCTDWDQQQQLNLDAFFDDAYNAPFQTTDPDLLASQYFNNRSSLGIRGCSVGAY